MRRIDVGEKDRLSQRAPIEFDCIDADHREWDCHSAQCSPAVVMRQFDEVFLSDRFDRARWPKPGALDRLALARNYRVRKLRHHSKKFAR